MKNSSPRASAIVILLALLIAACGTPATAIPLSPIAQESPPIKSSITIVTSTPAPAGLWIGDSVPVLLRERAEHWHLPANASLHLDISTSATEGAQSYETHSQWVYALVAPFPTVTDGVTL